LTALPLEFPPLPKLEAGAFFNSAVLSMSLRAFFAKQSPRQNWGIASFAGTLTRNDILILRIAGGKGRQGFFQGSVLRKRKGNRSALSF